MPRAITDRCPKCGGPSVEIIHGYRTPEMEERAARGEIALGGCLVGGFESDRHCNACGHEWRRGFDPVRAMKAQTTLAAEIQALQAWEDGRDEERATSAREVTAERQRKRRKKSDAATKAHARTPAGQREAKRKLLATQLITDDPEISDADILRECQARGYRKGRSGWLAAHRKKLASVGRLRPK